MAEGAVMFLLEQLRWITIGHRDLLSGAEDEFEQLTKEFVLLKAFLEEMVKKKDGRRHSMVSRQMTRQIRDVVYEVEDTIGICLTNANKSHLKATNLSSLAKRVRSIREDKVLPLTGMISHTQRFADDAAGALEDPQAISVRTQVPLIRQKRVVDFEDEEERIIGYLKEKTEHLNVISIVGIPGQGKTTLAWKIYQSDDIGSVFSILIWINISQSYNIRNVFLQILRKFIPSQDTSYLDDDELVQIVHVCMEKEKFLLVLDDVWSVDAWNQIKEVLSFNNGEGKVLITTREFEVGMITSVYRKPHKLRFLNRDESWRLLQYEAFWDSENYPQELSDIGNHIAIKCHGVPLVIVVVGGILRRQLIKSPSSAVREWETVSKSVSEALQRYGAKRITDVVGLSYQRLPDDLRECFLYLGVFPEGFEIPAKMLCCLWISEGFVFARRGRSLEESAEENMNHLIRRNLLEVKKTNHMGKVKTCRVHVMIRAFCIYMSRDEKLYEEIKISRQRAFEPSSSEVQNSQCLCFSSDLSTFLSKNPRGPHVRSFLCFYERPIYLEPEYISVIPDGFEKLRILEFMSIIFHQFPAKVVKLFHLRYLTLNIDTLLVLPEAIAQLWNLQTLVVETKSPSITMKANMWRMFQLRCLKTSAAIVLDNEWEGEAGENLHTLSRLAAESYTPAVSRRLKTLNILAIYGKLACISQTNGLQQWICFPPNLKRLTLSNTYLSWKHMHTLAMSKSLESLKLRDNAFVGPSWAVDGYDFPSLQLLLMVNINLIQWEASTDAFPRLRFLEVNNCENLREIPKCVGRNLEKLEIYRVRVSVVESAMRIAKTKKEKAKGKYGVQFNLSIGAVWKSQLFELECNILFGEAHK